MLGNVVFLADSAVLPADMVAWWPVAGCVVAAASVSFVVSKLDRGAADADVAGCVAACPGRAGGG